MGYTRPDMTRNDQGDSWNNQQETGEISLIPGELPEIFQKNQDGQQYDASPLVVDHSFSGIPPFYRQYQAK